VFHNDVDAAITCPGRMAASRCSKALHLSMVEYLVKDQSRKDRQKEKRRRVDDAVDLESAASNSNNTANDMAM
jgi:hypothetical protein